MSNLDEFTQEEERRMESSNRIREKIGSLDYGFKTIKETIIEIKATIKETQNECNDIKLENVDIRHRLAIVDEKLDSILHSLEQHVKNDVSFITILKDKWAYVSMAAVAYILWHLFTNIVDSKIVQRLTGEVESSPITQPYKYRNPQDQYRK